MIELIGTFWNSETRLEINKIVVVYKISYNKTKEMH